jgi:hypothetical protein
MKDVLQTGPFLGDASNNAHRKDASSVKIQTWSYLEQDATYPITLGEAINLCSKNNYKLHRYHKDCHLKVFSA